MNFKELKEEIDKRPNKKSFFNYNQISLDEKDHFEIISALYSSGIDCDDISTVADIYNITDTYQLDEQLFNNPFYIKVTLKAFDEKTIDIINQLESSIYIQIQNDMGVNVKLKEAQMLAKIKHERCELRLNSYVYQDAIALLASKFSFDAESSPVLVIDEINASTINIIQLFCASFSEPRFRIEIKDANSLQNLETIIPYIPGDDIFVIIDDDLFNEKRPNNARNLIVQDHNGQVSQDKKLNIHFNDIQYENIEQIYELEKYLEIIKSHIPAKASDLDIITYVSIFIINYFKYDYDMYEKIKSRNTDDFKDINLTQFISKGKGVCYHFAKFTQYLLNSLGVECVTIEANGDYNNPEELGHAFNVVKIDGKMYFLDNTWLAERIQMGEVLTLADSSDFLTSNADFEHTEYEDSLEVYECETYNREEINASVDRVLNWHKNYQIHLTALRDLFRKYILKKELSIDDKIENAIPRRR